MAQRHLRAVVPALAAAFVAVSLAHRPPAAIAAPPAGRVQFTDVTAASGITFLNATGDPDRKDYIFEVKGGGVGALDYDNDGWVDLVFSRGSSLERWKTGANPGPILYRNRGDGTFEDVTQKAGLTRGGWGVGISAADYDNDGFVDLYLTNLGPDVLYHNNGDGTFTDVTDKAGIHAPGWSSSAAFGDFDGDGFLDLYVASYLDVGPDKLPEGRAGGTCSYLGVPVLCGPRGLPGARDLYFHNNGNGTFTEQSEASGAFDKERYFGLGVVASDVDGDGDLDIYVGNDATPNYLFVNRGDGHFDERGFPSGTAVSGDGNEQASMGVDAADYDNDGRPDLYSTHFASDYSTLYHNLGGLLFEDVTARARIREPEWPLVKWGTAFVDLDQDGWKDILHANGHVYPHLRSAGGKETYEQPALTIYLNNRDGTFRDASGEAGPDAVEAGARPGHRARRPRQRRRPRRGGGPPRPEAAPPPERLGRRPLADAADRGPQEQPGRDRRPRHGAHRGASAGAGGQAHRGGLLGERPACALRPRDGERGRPRAGGVAEREGRRVPGRGRRPALPRRRGGGALTGAPPQAVRSYLTSTQWRPTYSRPFVNCSGTGCASALSHCATASPTLAPATS